MIELMIIKLFAVIIARESHDKVSAEVAKMFHRSKAWACEWLKRYGIEGINGLKTRPKSGRPTEISEEI